MLPSYLVLGMQCNVLRPANCACMRANIVASIGQQHLFAYQQQTCTLAEVPSSFMYMHNNTMFASWLQYTKLQCEQHPADVMMVTSIPYWT